MENTKKTPDETFQDSKFNFCCGKFEKMYQMMQKFCKDESGGINCETMIQKFFGDDSKKSDQA